jgi:hypothetical protein
MLDHEFVRLESVCRATGPGTRSSEAWTALGGVADAWSDYVMVRGILHHVANRAQSLALAGPATTDTTTGREASQRSYGQSCDSLPVRAGPVWGVGRAQAQGPGAQGVQGSTGPGLRGGS